MASTDKKDQPKIKVYWLNESRAQRLIWLLEELHLDYETAIFYRDKDMMAPPELQEIHPLGKAPIVTIQSPSINNGEKPLVLAESGFIMQYLTEHFAKSSPNPTLIPQRWKPGQEGQLGGETESYLRYQYFLHYPEGSLQPSLLVSIVLDIMKSNKMPFPVRPITSFVASKFFSAFVIPHINTDLAFLEKQLETAPDGGGYICGSHLTPADILLTFPLQLTKDRIGKVDASIHAKYPKLWAYLERLKGEEGYKRADRRIEEAEKADKCGGKK
ncbi:glutathione S-transferase 1 [Rhypophila decipiens]|uniref:Glutathione S-transferase 1 n=1 Tax=Rhypophila decipiens TaxID=261697 RepID=A0AAN6YC74_9PEZI|nr:glutathione S-transferase 1 [Rhypophila decipiens]